jgi:hypothetical protein
MLVESADIEHARELRVEVRQRALDREHEAIPARQKPSIRARSGVGEQTFAFGLCVLVKGSGLLDETV